ncbi:carbohydrate-binding protein [Nonomuraea ferruginea]
MGPPFRDPGAVLESAAFGKRLPGVGRCASERSSLAPTSWLAPSRRCRPRTPPPPGTRPNPHRRSAPAPLSPTGLATPAAASATAPTPLGAHAQFTVTAGAGGAATLRIRFANGTTGSRPAGLTVNGAAAGTLSFEGTGAWSTWQTATVTVPVNSGANTVRLNPTTSAGLPNLDYLDAETGGEQPTNTLYVATNGDDAAPGPWPRRCARSSGRWTWRSPVTRSSSGAARTRRARTSGYSRTALPRSRSP